MTVQAAGLSFLFKLTVRIPSFLSFDMKTTINIAEARDKYRFFLKNQGMFFTKERNTILACVLERTDHFSAEDLFLEMQNSRKLVSRATVYRSLTQMMGAGILIEADFGHGHTHYELALGNKYHAHLVCKSTGKVKEVFDEKLNVHLQRLAKSHGFRVSHKKVQLFGEFEQPGKGTS
jgi:Fur family ferric uptake transcriptional regulator